MKIEIYGQVTVNTTKHAKENNILIPWISKAFDNCVWMENLADTNKTVS